MSDLPPSAKYRGDGRTFEEFQHDIKEGSRIEREIIERYCKLTNQHYEQFGNDDGEFKEKSKCEPDFIVNEQFVEVKFCRNNVSRFHLKKHHVETYIKQRAMILFVMGWDTETPKWTLIDPKDILDKPVKMFYNKLSFLCKRNEFTWTDL